MSKELIVSAGRHETRVAILEDDQVVELFHEREKEYSLAGSIHKGRVTRVLPGMQSAFVDIGLERDAFLYVSDFFEDNDEYDAVVSTVEDKILKMEKGPSGPPDAAAYTRRSFQSDQPAVDAPAGDAAPPAPTERREGHHRGGRPDRGHRPPPADRTPEAVAPSLERTAEPGAERPPAGDKGGDRGGDRGGRGRRGRRRRGGRSSSLPDSKFFTPGSEPVVAADEADEPEEVAAAPVAATEQKQQYAPAVSHYQSYLASRQASQPASHSSSPSSSSGDDFLVLPGESLAKYSPDADRSPEPVAYMADSGPMDEPSLDSGPMDEPSLDSGPMDEPSIEAEVPAVECALPSEHPLAGLGTISSWTAEPSTPAETAPEPVADAAASIPEPATPVASAEPVEVEPPSPVHTEEATGSAWPDAPPGDIHEPKHPKDDECDPDLTPAEVTASEIIEDGGLLEDVVVAEEGGPDEEGFDEAVTGPGAPVEDEGPEPARSPVSLTATLREQGHRYPHRVSRRMRRKMRGGEEGGTKQLPADSSAPIEEAVITQPDSEGGIATEPQEERAPRERNDRNQDRGPRGERGERPERGERNDRGERPERTERPDRERPPLPSISDLLKEGQEIVVQIAKEPLGQKGARITSHIALPGRFVVYMPTVEHVGVSRKIPSDEERQRLKRVLQTHRQGVPGGFICRTAAEGKTEEELRVDMHFLYNLWLDMRQKAEKKPAPVLLHHDLDLVQRILRDQLTTSFKTIWVDNEELYESILSFVQRFQPALVGRVKLYTRSNPIFDEFGITNEVEKALRPKVWLKSGGYIVINQTEALVAIDINTGKFVGKTARLEDTIVKINTDAIKEIVRQIRLRDLGGIIVVDFIDMDERKNRQKVMLALEEGMRADRAPYKILQFNDFGLVAITRKRVKQSLERTLCAPCNYCEGAGYIKSVGTVISEILQEAVRMQRALKADTGNVMLRVNPEVAKVLKSNSNTYLQELEEIAGRTVMVKSDPLLHQTKFDLA